ncbi:hypothetical protein THAOC_05920 [Thalassiosira oceanica]|uniref:Uncharacterized protein n=1 Tax=Thalassiosira oceanica TaxID=159749 RepID=K0TG04_THAOC|nr:hypothetical protein THAOC_05920 [Thalassiosira oceanica]|eukprot:EJK72541.1 hypothetical protein THAOC_05920 [Thalassiosira oceanica]
MESIPTGGDDANAAPVLCQKSGCKVISKRHQVKIYEAEQSERPSQNAWVSVVLVAAIAVAIRMFLVKRVSRARNFKTGFTQKTMRPMTATRADIRLPKAFRLERTRSIHSGTCCWRPWSVATRIPLRPHRASLTGLV